MRPAAASCSHPGPSISHWDPPPAAEATTRCDVRCDVRCTPSKQVRSLPTQQFMPQRITSTGPGKTINPKPWPGQNPHPGRTPAPKPLPCGDSNCQGGRARHLGCTADGAPIMLSDAGPARTPDHCCMMGSPLLALRSPRITAGRGARCDFRARRQC